MKVIYQGVSKEHREKVLKAFEAQLDPPESPAQGIQYHPEQNDHPLVVQRKMEATAKWKSERVAEHVAHLDSLDKEKVVEGLVFPKGVVVDVPEDHRANVIPLPDGSPKDGPLHGHIKAKVFTVVEDPEKPYVTPEVAADPEKAKGKKGKR